MTDDNNLEERIERIEREMGLYEQDLRAEMEQFASAISAELVEINTGTFGDTAVFRIDRAFNRTDFKKVSDRYSSFMLYTPDENTKGDWVALEIDL